MEKIIHYCWFGKNKKNKKIRKCINSWKVFFPNWQIIEWNENNFDVNCCPYVKEAYDLKKWAFVADYCRFFVLFNYGGLFFDTDVEIIKTIPSSFFEKKFLALEDGKSVSIAPGLIFYSLKNDEFCKKMLDEYNSEHFEKDGFTYKTVCERADNFFINLGFVKKNEYQEIGEYSIYPSDFFSPINNYTKKVLITKNTYSIHHYLGTWLSKKERLSIFINRFLRKVGLKNEK